jgi:hypothetical protein
MTLHLPMAWGNPKKARKQYRKGHYHIHKGRVLRSFYSQFKRYPHSKAVLDLRNGEKTNTSIFPEGYDPSFRIVTKVPHSPTTRHRTECAYCKLPLGTSVGESGLYQSDHILCVPCWEDEDQLIETQGTNSGDISDIIRTRLEEYGNPNREAYNDEMRCYANSF